MKIVVKDLKDPFYNDYKLKSIDIVDYSSVLNKERLNFIRKDLTTKTKILCGDCTEVYWKIKVDDKLINEQDLNYMLKEVNKNEKIKWNLDKLKIDSLQINLLEFPDMENCKKTDKERMRRTETKSPLFLISAPIFNRKKNIAILNRKYIFWPNSNNTKIFKKEKGKWILIGEIH